MAQRKLTQDQKGFSAGEISSGTQSKFGNIYYQSVKKLENYIVNPDDSISPRKRFVDSANSFPLNDVFSEILSLNDIKFSLFENQVNVLTSQGGFSLSFSYNNIYVYLPTGTVDFRVSLKTTGEPPVYGIEDSLEGLDRTPVKIRKFGEEIFVFVRNGFPFKIYLSEKGNDTFIVVAPFYSPSNISKGTNNFAENFPFSQIDENLQTGDFFYEKLTLTDSSQRLVKNYTTGQEPSLVIVKENLEKNECLCFLDPGYFESSKALDNTKFFIDCEYAGLKNFLGKPIIVGISSKSIFQDRLVYPTTSENEEGESVTTPLSPLDSSLNNVAEEIYPGKENYTEWDLDREDTDVFVPSNVVLPLFLPLGYRFYLIVPYEFVEPSSDSELDTLDSSKKFLTAEKFYQRAEKLRYGQTPDGNAYYSKCRIFELGYKTSKEYQDSQGDTVRIIGGRRFVFPDDLEDASKPSNYVNYSSSFLLNDWNDDYPKDGGFFDGKSFLITQKGKISFSKRREFSVFSNPIKTFLSLITYNYLYGSSFYNYPSVEDLIRGGQDNLFGQFLRDVELQKDSYLININDPLTFDLRRNFEGNTDIFSYTFLTLLRASNDRSIIFASNRGLFAFYFNQTVDVSRYYDVSKISDYVIDRQVPIQNINDILYFLRNGELYFSRYSEDSRRFRADKATPTFHFKDSLVKFVPFLQNRCIFLLRDSQSSRQSLYCANVTGEGPFLGFSEWKVSDSQIVNVFKYESDVIFSFNTLNNVQRNVTYPTLDTQAFVESFDENTDSLVKLLPLTNSPSAPYMHGLDYTVRVEDLYLFSQNLSYLELLLNGKSFSVQKFDNSSNVLKEIDSLAKKRVLQGFNEDVYNIDIQLKQRVGDLGSIGGFQFVYYLRDTM